MLLELGEGRVGFSDAHRRVVPSTKSVGYPARDYEDSGLVGNGSCERVDLETVVGVRSAEYGVR
jgi:hypothetical protein